MKVIPMMVVMLDLDDLSVKILPNEVQVGSKSKRIKEHLEMK